MAHGASAAIKARRARALKVHMLRLLRTESEHSGAQARHTRNPPHQARARAGTWEHGLASKKGGFSFVQHPPTMHGASAASAARRARASEAHMLRLLRTKSERSGAQARYTRKPPHQVRARALHVGAQPCTKEGRLLAYAAPLYGARTECRERGAACAHVGSARAGTPPRESERSGAQARYTHKPPHQVRARTLHIGAQHCTKEGRLPACAAPFHSSRSECHERGAARARVGSAHAAPPPDRERAQWRASALHAQATSPSEGQGFARGSTALHRRRAASRLCSALPWRMERVPRVRRGARAL